MNIKSNRGLTLVELMAVMAIMAILAATLSATLSTGSRLFRRTDDTYKAQTEARVAMSYITMKLRQHDRTGGVAVNDQPGNPYLQLTSGGTTTKIYHQDKKLVEQIEKTDGSIVFTDIAEHIKAVEFSQSSDKKLIIVSIKYFDGNGSEKALSKTVILRSDQ